jgi:hypothetical protein
MVLPSLDEPSFGRAISNANQKRMTGWKACPTGFCSGSHSLPDLASQRRASSDVIPAGVCGGRKLSDAGMTCERGPTENKTASIYINKNNNNETSSNKVRCYAALLESRRVMIYDKL